MLFGNSCAHRNYPGNLRPFIVLSSVVRSARVRGPPTTPRDIPATRQRSRHSDGTIYYGFVRGNTVQTPGRPAKRRERITRPYNNNLSYISPNVIITILITNTSGRPKIIYTNVYTNRSAGSVIIDNNRYNIVIPFIINIVAVPDE